MLGSYQWSPEHRYQSSRHRDANSAQLGTTLNPKTLFLSNETLNCEQERRLVDITIKAYGWWLQAWSLESKRRQLDMLDQRLRDNFDEEQVRKVFSIALLSTQDSVAARPSMSRIAAMLNDEEPLPQLPAKPEAVKSLGLCDQNVSGTFTSSFVTPKFVTPSKKWTSKKHRAANSKFGNDPSDRDGVYRLWPQTLNPKNTQKSFAHHILLDLTIGRTGLLNVYPVCSRLEPRLLEAQVLLTADAVQQPMFS